MATACVVSNPQHVLPQLDTPVALSRLEPRTAKRYPCCGPHEQWSAQESRPSSDALHGVCLSAFLIGALRRSGHRGCSITSSRFGSTGGTGHSRCAFGRVGLPRHRSLRSLAVHAVRNCTDGLTSTSEEADGITVGVDDPAEADAAIATIGEVQDHEGRAAPSEAEARPGPRRQEAETPLGVATPLGIADRYTSEKWWQHLIDFPYSTILRRISLHLACNTLLAACISGFNAMTHKLTPLPATPLILCSTALGLLLVFRTSAAYERWSLGQQSTYLMRHHLQQILRVMRPWFSEERFERLQGEVCKFPRIIAVHLTGFGGSGKPGAGLMYSVGPRDLITQISDELTVYFSGKHVPMAALYDLDRAKGHINQVLLSVTEMERLSCEAVPRDYSRHTSRFLTVWMWALPFVLLDCGPVLMPVVVCIVSWALLSIEEIGHTLEDPFNSPTQAVPLQPILEAGGGEHSLRPGMIEDFPVPPAPPLWERRISWGQDNS